MRILTILLVVFSIAFTFGQSKGKTQHNKAKSETPKVVTDAFNRDFSDATNAKWKKDQADFEVKFTSGGVKKSATYDAKGNLVETIVPVSSDDIPSASKEYIAKNYKSAKIDQAHLIDGKKGKQYQVEITAGKKKHEILFDSKGKFVK